MTAISIDDLAQKIGIEIREAEAEALALWRRWASEADIRRARIEYRDSIDIYEKTLVDKRNADQAVKTAREAHAELISDTEYALEVCFEKKGNSWVQMIDGANGSMTPLPEPRPVTADARKEWLTRTAGRTVSVTAAARKLSEAEWAQAQAVDAISVADRRVTAAKYQLQAATVMLTTLAQAMPTGAR